ncbi:TetR/AcrR family transcriptional regulator [Microvirga puerhi]|uniref:TetR/AcrR family transcriptional regulator n=1 Tax=Microvirga puerhi TaxID=2876078 RepID=A0ABS7VTS9_9HYPH|nr:TetR/AcrR family transcriptional regulator [Microvirga puerhi]MBZ6078965.1 TetR/AcrR family transcriptional regulator [Microvirga puerhi]
MATVPNRRRTQVDRSAETRAILIRAAIELLQTLGFAGTSTALIAKRAGVTTGALHHHFATKDELLFGVLDHASERMRARLEQEKPVSPAGTLNISDTVRHLWEVYGNPEYWATWEIIIGTRSDPALHPRVVAHRLETMRMVLHPWLEHHTSEEGTRPEVIALFEFMLIAIRGLSLERFLDKDEAYFDRNLKILADLVGQRLEALAQHNFVR